MHTTMSIETAAEAVMHQIATGRVNAKDDDPGIRADIKPFICGEWPAAMGSEKDALNILTEAAGYGPDAYGDDCLSEFWIDGFGADLTRVRTAAGIIRKARESAKVLEALA